MLDNVLRKIKGWIPRKLFSRAQPTYHYLMALLSAIVYQFPSKKLIVIGITGTKGKTTTAELVNAILEEAGYTTALSSTLRIKVANTSERNMYKMTMPGRMFVQRFLRSAVKNKCQYAIMEMTSEGASLHRHKFIQLDALIFTNLTPEHIASHGSFENYREAKLKIVKSLRGSGKSNKVIISNVDDDQGNLFIKTAKVKSFPYSISDAREVDIKREGLEFTWDKRKFVSRLSGEFNLYNILAALTLGKALHVSTSKMVMAIINFTGIRGRVERIEEGQDFVVIVDYAHTIDSLEKLYEVFAHSKNICVLGKCGGGRDRWNIAKMAQTAEKHCEHIIFTNEDPYDDDPQEIVEEMLSAVKTPIAEIILDRREAIKKALSHAKTGDSVLITGKGTDPYIMGPNGTKVPWDDASVAREELRALLKSRK